MSSPQSLLVTTGPVLVRRIYCTRTVLLGCRLLLDMQDLAVRTSTVRIISRTFITASTGDTVEFTVDWTTFIKKGYFFFPLNIIYTACVFPICLLLG